MNSMQIIPFTGRNLPLLSAASLSDVLRWSVLFSCAVLIMVADRDPQVRRWPELALVAKACGRIAIVCVSPILILMQGQVADSRTLQNRKPGAEIAWGGAARLRPGRRSAWPG